MVDSYSDIITYKVVCKNFIKLGLYNTTSFKLLAKQLLSVKVTNNCDILLKTLVYNHENIDSKNQLPDLYNPENGMGFFGYIFLLIIVSVSVVGIIKTFEDDWLSYFPQDQYIFDLLDEQLEYIFETFRNVVTIIKDLINSY